MFEYDPDKSAVNLAKHGIDFEQAQDLWLDWRRVAIDVVSETEARIAITGRIAGKHWTAIVTPRGEATRIISVRRAREQEVRRYEQEID